MIMILYILAYLLVGIICAINIYFVLFSLLIQGNITNRLFFKYMKFIVSSFLLWPVSLVILLIIVMTKY